MTSLPDGLPVVQGQLRTHGLVEIEHGLLVRIRVVPCMPGVALVEQLGASSQHRPPVSGGLHALGDACAMTMCCAITPAGRSSPWPAGRCRHCSRSDVLQEGNQVVIGLSELPGDRSCAGAHSAPGHPGGSRG